MLENQTRAQLIEEIVANPDCLGQAHSLPELHGLFGIPLASAFADLIILSLAHPTESATSKMLSSTDFQITHPGLGGIIQSYNQTTTETQLAD